MNAWGLRESERGEWSQSVAESFLETLTRCLCCYRVSVACCASALLVQACPWTIRYCIFYCW